MRFVQNAIHKKSRRQRLTAAQTVLGVSQSHPSPEKPTQGEEPPKKRGFGSLISEGHTHTKLRIGSRLLIIVLVIGLGRFR